MEDRSEVKQKTLAILIALPNASSHDARAGVANTSHCRVCRATPSYSAASSSSCLAASYQ